MADVNYTEELYGKLQTVINELDATFFNGKGKEHIPSVVMAINNRCSSCVVAFVSPNSLYDKNTDRKIQYLGINPFYLSRNIGYILCTVCHEICHIYENAYVHIPRGGYHDKAWAELMLDCGLEPVYMNKSKTAVSEKIIEGGAFEKFIKDFAEKYGAHYFNVVEYSTQIEHITRIKLGIEEGNVSDDSPHADNENVPVKTYNRNKFKYTCPDCGAKVWGKTGLNIECSDCACAFEEEDR